MHPKLTAPIDDTYLATAHSVSTLIEWHTDNPHVSRLVLSAQILFPLLATLFLMLFFIYVIELEPRNFGKKLNNQIYSSIDYISASGEAKVLITLTISVLFNVCALITDSFALKEYHRLSPEVKKYYYHESTEFRCFFSIPYLMIAFDASSSLFIIIPVTIVVARYCHSNGNGNNNNHDNNNDNNNDVDNDDNVNDDNHGNANNTNWSILLYTLLSPLSCIATHAYHIIIAFIDNPYHGSSVLLLFIAVLFIHVVVFQEIYYYLFKWKNSDQISTCCDPIKNNRFSWIILLLSFYMIGIISLSVIIGLTVSMLILLPIKNAIDNAPNNIYAIYQGSVAIAALVTFQVFFRETNSITEVFIKARDKMPNDNNWRNMSEREKELKLAELFLQYIIRKSANSNQPGNQNQPGDPNQHGNANLPGPGNPNQPGDPNQHGNANLPGPGNPNQPGNQNQPGDPNQHGNANLPGRGNLNQPGNPNLPGNLNQPGKSPQRDYAHQADAGNHAAVQTSPPQHTTAPLQGSSGDLQDDTLHLLSASSKNDEIC